MALAHCGADLGRQLYRCAMNQRLLPIFVYDVRFYKVKRYIKYKLKISEKVFENYFSIVSPYEGEKFLDSMSEIIARCIISYESENIYQNLCQKFEVKPLFKVRMREMLSGCVNKIKR